MYYNILFSPSSIVPCVLCITNGYVEGGGPEEQKQLAEAQAKCEALQKALADLQVQLQQQKDSEAAARSAEAAAKQAEEQAKQVSNGLCFHGIHHRLFRLKPQPCKPRRKRKMQKQQQKHRSKLQKKLKPRRKIKSKLQRMPRQPQKLRNRQPRRLKLLLKHKNRLQGMLRRKLKVRRQTPRRPKNKPNSENYSAHLVLIFVVGLKQLLWRLKHRPELLRTRLSKQRMRSVQLKMKHGM